MEKREGRRNFLKGFFMAIAGIILSLPLLKQISGRQKNVSDKKASYYKKLAG